MTDQVLQDPAAKTAEPRGWAQVVLGVAGTIEERNRGGGSSRGDRAVLRRMRADEHIFPAPFWSLIGKYDISPTDEAFWIDVIPLMVKHRHNTAISAGRALAEAKVSRARVERWLRLDAPRARREARRLLSKVDTGFDWVQFASLLRWWNAEAQRRFARDFFLTRDAQEKQRTSAKENDR
jgi:CRISPR type I-E-associated protein CasB/Cse2